MQDPKNNIIPNRDEISLFPKFKNLPEQQIILIKNEEQCLEIQQDIEKIQVFGFDTESKPTFRKGETNTGPHLIQLSSMDRAYLFQVNAVTLAFLKPVLSNPNQLKVGFGLKNDQHLFRKKNIELQGIMDISKSFKAFGIENPLGVKNAIALLFKQNVPKNKKISTSNWSKSILTPEQIQYAAADAYAALHVYLELSRLGCIK